VKNNNPVFLLWLLAFSFCPYGISAQQVRNVPPDRLARLKLFTTDTKPYSLRLEKPAILIFLSPECPLSKNYAPVLNALQVKYPQVKFYGIFPGKSYSDKEIRAFQEDYKIRFTLLKDPLKLLTQYVHATTTPQVVFLDRKGSVLYDGLINNWAVSLGQKRKIVTEHYLKDAIDQVLNNKPVFVKHTQPVGCLINDM
jgi:thiol-disulfide isomerase/thioredoxin